MESNSLLGSSTEKPLKSNKDERTRAVYESRDRARRESAAYEDEIRLKAKIEVARNLVQMDMPLVDIIKATELPSAIVRELSKTK